MRLAALVFRLTASIPREQMYVFSAQMRRAALSVPCNIAEGNRRGYTRDYVRFLAIARSSVAELETSIELAVDLAYLSRAHATELLDIADHVSRMLNRMSQRLSR